MWAMKATLILIFAVLLGTGTALAKGKRTRPQISQEIFSFSSDGCSAYPDGLPHTEEYEWLHCCMTHDMAYWAGGTHEEKVKADAQLGQCVAEASTVSHGRMMEMGVIIGGVPYISTSWRWGYGWNRMISYKELSQDEKEQVIREFDSILDEIENYRQYLTSYQLGYVLSRYELLRRDTLGDKVFTSNLDQKAKDLEEVRANRIIELLESQNGL